MNRGRSVQDFFFPATANLDHYRAVKHPALRVFHKCENLICVQVGQLRLQRLMEKPSSSR
ncbi:Tfiih basal transcription factor complex p44 subunit [Daphnia magna]|uniref:Tfiih basal transcription factor complex p44 subunit n=1 Tax=Daphnia magna TaxID=35525 RepID=A0A164PXE3_9CRUS|nr:Tfiih basal transcription factor complex p44 subunit [Daphnia magna]